MQETGEVDTGRSGMEGVHGKRSQRGSGYGRYYILPLEVRRVPMLGAAVTEMRAGVRGRHRATQRGDRALPV